MADLQNKRRFSAPRVPQLSIPFSNLPKPVKGITATLVTVGVIAGIAWGFAFVFGNLLQAGMAFVGLLLFVLACAILWRVWRWMRNRDSDGFFFPLWCVGTSLFTLFGLGIIINLGFWMLGNFVIVLAMVLVVALGMTGWQIVKAFWRWA